MDIVILDLEWNAAYSRKNRGYINEIIEFGAVKCRADLSVLDSFSCLVRPQVSKKMNPYTADLTNLDLEQLSSGLTFPAVLSRFTKWAGDCVILTWGNSDVLALIENCNYFGGDGAVPFLRRYCDVQRYVQDCLGTGTAEQLGLSRAAELLGLDLSSMAHHRALDDSLMTLEVLKQVYREGGLDPFTDLCDQEFYRKISFRARYITELKDPLVKAEHLQFDCPQCGTRAKRNGRWSLRNKSFRADFSCPACGFAFSGRVTMKEKYEGLAVSKKTAPLPIIEAPRAAEPGRVGDMELEIENGVGLLRFPEWKELPVDHAFSTRIGGVSEREYAAMNLGFSRGDEAERVAENYRRFCAAGGFDPDSPVTGAQDHHLNIRRVGSEHRGLGVWRDYDMESVDGLCTDDPAVTLVIYCADCVPLYFYDPEHRAIGLAHAGWRGTVSGMAREMAGRMAEEFGTRPEELRVAIGPSICGESFEVDPPVAEEFLRLEAAERFVFGPQVNAAGAEKYHVDLWECNRQYLLACGVLPEHITVGGVDTLRNSDLLFSHRKTRGKRGSNAAFLTLRAAQGQQVQ